MKGHREPQTRLVAVFSPCPVSMPRRAQFRIVDFVTALQAAGVISSPDQASGLVVRLDPAGTRTATIGSLRVLVSPDDEDCVIHMCIVFENDPCARIATCTYLVAPLLVNIGPRL